MEEKFHDQWDKVSSEGPGEPVESLIWAGVESALAGKKKRLSLILSSIGAVGAAAAIFLGVLLWRNGAGSVPASELNTISYHADSDMDINLPDGSSVFLQSGSVLRWVSVNRDDRVVELDGNAIFDVVTTPDRNLFSVRTRDGIITVKGTTFSVNSEDESNLSVTLFSGKVDFSVVNGGQVVSLQPMNTLTYDSSSSEISVRPSFGGVSWNDGKFIIDNAGIDDVVAFLRWWFNAEIRIDGDLTSSHTFVGRVSTDDTLDMVLDKFSFMMNVRYDKVGGAYHLHR